MDKIQKIMRKLKENKKNKFIYRLIYLKVNVTPRNIFIALTDADGAVLIKNSTGLLGYKGSKKTTPFIVNSLVKDIFKKAFRAKIKYNFLIVQYFGNEYDTQLEGALKALRQYRVRRVLYLEILEKRAHNGVRKRKKSR